MKGVGGILKNAPITNLRLDPVQCVRTEMSVVDKDWVHVSRPMDPLT